MGIVKTLELAGAFGNKNEKAKAQDVAQATKTTSIDASQPRSERYKDL